MKHKARHFQLLLPEGYVPVEEHSKGKKERNGRERINQPHVNDDRVPSLKCYLIVISVHTSAEIRARYLPFFILLVREV